MARVSGNTLGLGELGYATGHNANVSTTTSMSTVNGGTDGSPSLDDFGIDGDFVESQAFAYLAIRSFLKLHISFPSTTGCKKPCSGGVIVKNY